MINQAEKFGLRQAYLVKPQTSFIQMKIVELTVLYFQNLIMVQLYFLSFESMQVIIVEDF